VERTRPAPAAVTVLAVFASTLGCGGPAEVFTPAAKPAGEAPPEGVSDPDELGIRTLKTQGGPTVFVWYGEPFHNEAYLTGRLRYLADAGCFVLENNDDRFAVAWPPGTRPYRRGDTFGARVHERIQDEDRKFPGREFRGTVRERATLVWGSTTFDLDDPRDMWIEVPEIDDRCTDGRRALVVLYDLSQSQEDFPGRWTHVSRTRIEPRPGQRGS
jgi:hypothetical protein